MESPQNDHEFCCSKERFCGSVNYYLQRIRYPVFTNTNLELLYTISIYIGVVIRLNHNVKLFPFSNSSLIETGQKTYFRKTTKDAVKLNDGEENFP